MKIALTSTIILLFLLPGVGFFLGLYSRDRYPRSFGRQNSLAELAMAAFVAVICHAILFLLISLYIELFTTNGYRVFLSPLLHIEQKIYLRAGDIVWRFYAILGYSLAAGFLSFLVGRKVSSHVVSGKFRALARHSWVYELIAIGGQYELLTKCYILTNIQHEDKILMYKGYIEEFYLDDSGGFSYIVLNSCSRFYMALSDAGPKTQYAKDGESFPITGDSDGMEELSDIDGAWPQMIISGSTISNIAIETIHNVDIDDLGYDEISQTLNSRIAEYNAIIGELNLGNK